MPGVMGELGEERPLGTAVALAEHGYAYLPNDLCRRYESETSL